MGSLLTIDTNGERESPLKITLLVLRGPNSDFSENGFVLNYFMLFFKTSVTFSAAPTKLSDSNIQLYGTMS